jgi:ribokinase
MYDIVTFGNAVVDVFLSIHHASDFCRIDEQEQELCVRYGEKIPLEQGTFLLGGNACNVAVGMSRLGFRSALIAELGSDEFAQKIRTGLQAEGVSGEYLHRTDTGSSFSIALNFAGERTLFVEHVQRKHAFAYNGLRTPWFYITSLGVDWRPAYAAILDFAQQAGSRIAFSPGTPQLQEGTSGILPMLRQTEYLFVSRSEATRILGEPALGASTKELLLRLQGLGPRNVVMTSGSSGADALDADRRHCRQDIIQGPVVEMTGAGDSFATGYLAATMLGLDMPTALLWGSVNAASVIGQVGTQPGLLNRPAMLERVTMARSTDRVALGV